MYSGALMPVRGCLSTTWQTVLFPYRARVIQYDQTIISWKLHGRYTWTLILEPGAICWMFRVELECLRCIGTLAIVWLSVMLISVWFVWLSHWSDSFAIHFVSFHPLPAIPSLSLPVELHSVIFIHPFAIRHCHNELIKTHSHWHTHNKPNTGEKSWQASFGMATHSFTISRKE